jgi:hypothetical protein
MAILANPKASNSLLAKIVTSDAFPENQRERAQHILQRRAVADNSISPAPTRRRARLPGQ